MVSFYFGGLACVQPRTFSLRYSIDHQRGQLYILTNKDCLCPTKDPMSNLPFRQVFIADRLEKQYMQCFILAK
eukprot:578314-Amphidinium_carterae.1